MARFTFGNIKGLVRSAIAEAPIPKDLADLVDDYLAIPNEDVYLSQILDVIGASAQPNSIGTSTYVDFEIDLGPGKTILIMLYHGANGGMCVRTFLIPGNWRDVLAGLRTLPNTAEDPPSDGWHVRLIPIP
jgi:hypothetical protein